MKSELIKILLLALRNNDKRYFKENLEDHFTNTSDLEESDGFNIFHYFSISQLCEQDILEFIEIFYSVFINKFPRNSLCYLLDSISSRECYTTPLHIAIIRCKKVMFIKNLAYSYLSFGADPLITDNSGQNSMHLSARSGILSLFCYLIKEKKIDISTKDIAKGTVLHSAILNLKEDMAILIISMTNHSNYSLDSQNNEGNTPLHLSVSLNNYRITKHLLFMGANKNIENNLKQTVDKICQSHELKQLLQKNIEKKTFFYFLIVLLFITLQSLGLYIMNELINARQ